MTDLHHVVNFYGTVPSVQFSIEVPNVRRDSLYDGQVTLKDKVLNYIILSGMLLKLQTYFVMSVVIVNLDTSLLFMYLCTLIEAKTRDQHFGMFR